MWTATLSGDLAHAHGRKAVKGREADKCPWSAFLGSRREMGDPIADALDALIRNSRSSWIFDTDTDAQERVAGWLSCLCKRMTGQVGAQISVLEFKEVRRFLPEWVGMFSKAAAKSSADFCYQDRRLTADGIV